MAFSVSVGQFCLRWMCNVRVQRNRTQTEPLWFESHVENALSIIPTTILFVLKYKMKTRHLHQYVNCYRNLVLKRKM